MRLPSVLMMCMCLLDVVFNALLIFPDGAFCIGSLPIPGFDLGVRGAAIGTGLSQLTVDSVLYPHSEIKRSERTHYYVGTRTSQRNDSPGYCVGYVHW